MKKEFGATKNGEKASCYVLKNSKGMEAVVSDFGASLLKLYVPDKDGKTQDVVLGYETLEDYENGGDSLGATVGRVANRIGMAEFELNGKKYELTKNDNGKNTLHGGIDFYNKRMWDVKEEDDTHVVFALVSPDGDQGFPGEVKIEVSYTITEENELKIHYHAIPDQDTLLNMTNHSYFNLSGHASGTAWNAKVWIDADAFTETDVELIPTGTVVPVEGTPMDFRKEKVVEKEIGADYTPLKLAGGYDHNWVMEKDSEKQPLLNLKRQVLRWKCILTFRECSSIPVISLQDQKEKRELCMKKDMVYALKHSTSQMPFIKKILNLRSQRPEKYMIRQLYTNSANFIKI